MVAEGRWGNAKKFDINIGKAHLLFKKDKSKIHLCLEVRVLLLSLWQGWEMHLNRS